MTDRPRLEQEYAIDTPESVTFAYEVAGVGNRFIAALIDTTLLFTTLILLNLIVWVALGILDGSDLGVLDDVPSWAEGLVIALYALLNFVIYWGYYVLFEWIWNGQTPGKRIVKIRVLRMDGNPAGFVEVLLRNLVRPVDFLPGGYGLGLLVMLLNDKSRRLGDYAAGTLVIRELANVSLDALVTRPPSTAPAVDEMLLLAFPEIRRLTSTDYELLQETLARSHRGAISQHNVERLARALAVRLGVPAPKDWDNTLQFLEQVGAAYRQLGR